MAKKHLVMIASVAAALAVGAPMAMAAESPLPIPALPGIPTLPADGPVTPNGGECTYQEGTASATSDDPHTVQNPVGGVNDKNEGNCESSGNDQGNGVGGDVAFPPSVPGTGGSGNSVDVPQ